MPVVLLLKYGVIGSIFISLVSLSFLVIKTFSFGRRQMYAVPKGDVRKGIVYAFGKGMLPWEKESAMNHLPTYIAGIFYHIGVFAAIFYLLLTLVSPGLPGAILFFIRVLCLAGVIAGVALLVKRIISTPMRTLSCPDDFAANAIVDLFLISALFHTFYREMAPFFFLVAIIMFLYIPLGKIRHCFFFFYVRILFGIFYGRRNVYPREKMAP